MTDITTPLAAFLEADKKRTQGRWIYSVDEHGLCSVVTGTGRYIVDGESKYSEHDHQFIAAASVLPIRELVKQQNDLREAAKELDALYAYWWDSATDGSIILMESGVKKFEALHRKLEKTLSTTSDLSSLITETR